MEVTLLLKFIICMIPLICLWALSVMLVKAKDGKLKLGAKANFFEQLDVLSLTNNSSLHLVKLSKSKVLLLSVSSSQVNHIQTFHIDDLEPIVRQNLLFANGSLKIPSSQSELKNSLQSFFNSLFPAQKSENLINNNLQNNQTEFLETNK